MLSFFSFFFNVHFIITFKKWCSFKTRIMKCWLLYIQDIQSKMVKNKLNYVFQIWKFYNAWSIRCKTSFSIYTSGFIKRFLKRFIYEYRHTLHCVSKLSSLMFYVENKKYMTRLPVYLYSLFHCLRYRKTWKVR